MVSNVLTSADRKRERGEGWLFERGGGWGTLLCNSQEIPSLGPSKQHFSLETKAATAHIRMQNKTDVYINGSQSTGRVDQ